MPRNQSGRRMFSMNAKIIHAREEYGVRDCCQWWKIREVWFLNQGELLSRSSLERHGRLREGWGQEAAAPARACLLRKVPKCRESLEWNAGWNDGLQMAEKDAQYPESDHRRRWELTSSERRGCIRKWSIFKPLATSKRFISCAWRQNTGSKWQ